MLRAACLDVHSSCEVSGPGSKGKAFNNRAVAWCLLCQLFEPFSLRFVQKALCFAMSRDGSSGGVVRTLVITKDKARLRALFRIVQLPWWFHRAIPFMLMFAPSLQSYSS